MPVAKKPLPEELPVIDKLRLAGYEYEVDSPGWGFYHLDDIALKQVRRLKTIAFLDLFDACDGGRVSDQGLGQLSKNRSLVRLRLGPGITDDGVRSLRGLTQLTEFRLDSADAVTDRGAGYLATLTNLEALSLQYTQVGDLGVSSLANLTQLRELVLCRTRVTDAGLEHVMGMNCMTELLLSDTAITNAGVEKLCRLGMLKSLWLDGTQVSDAVVASLVGLTSLSRLVVSRTRLTKKGIAAIKKKLPHCTVS